MAEPFHRMKPEHHTKAADKLATKFHGLHSSLADIIKALLKNKNPEVKARVMQWMRSAVGLNMELQKTMTQMPVASQGFVLNYVDLLLQLCKPFTGAFEKYKNFLDKVNCTYLMTDAFV